MIINGGKPRETNKFDERVREWLAAMNKARVSKDRIDVQRVQQKEQEVGEMLQYVASGHVRLGDEMLTIVTQIGFLFSLKMHIQAAFRHSPKTVIRINTFLRDLEADLRDSLALATGSPVDPRDPSNDANEDAMIEKMIAQKVVPT